VSSSSFSDASLSRLTDPAFSHPEELFRGLERRFCT
jgi:hypothetical protein